VKGIVAFGAGYIGSITTEMLCNEGRQASGTDLSKIIDRSTLTRYSEFDAHQEVDMNDALKNMNSLMQTMMNNIQDNIYFKDREGRFVLASLSSARWYGFDSPEEVIGKTDFDIFTPEHAKEAFSDEQHIIKTGESVIGKEEQETWDDGHTTWVSTSKMPLYDEYGEIIGTFGISRDITDRKNAEIRAARYAEENQRFRNQLERELQIAGELQKTFFPTTYPTFPEGALLEESPVEFFHLYHAGEQVGGDFCSIKKLSGTEAGIFLCDVMGHGVRAALGTALIRGLIEEISTHETDPGRYLDRLNDALQPIFQCEDEILFATACYIIVNTSTGKIRFANAGHPSPVILAGSEHHTEPLFMDNNMCGPALAIFNDVSYTTFEKTLSPADTVFMFTDGIYEITDGNNEEYGEVRFMESASRYSDLPLPDLFSALLNDARQFAAEGSFEDDICLAGFRLRDISHSSVPG
jgi:sigma-B regulation protein RsbU (phosphoserine phosphatase)